MGKPSNQLELMAPAGDMACAWAAFQAGADSVYAGLGDFNARQRARNFTSSQLAALADWARRNGRKVYITCNTLWKETELMGIGDLLEAIDNICPDAVIVQDLGAIHVLRRYFPHLRIHGSTQMGTHNSAGVEMLDDLGVSRVILERQVTLEEIASIRRKTSLELEVFGHGALCCGLSGMCLFSSWMGGWSGNRGRCKQPCRRRFFSSEGNGFFFSTHDLYALDILHDLEALGINAVKIEGRLREPAYVSNVVTAYRMVRDAAPELPAAILKEARALLGRTGGRKWSSGFRHKSALAQVIAPTRPGGSGRLCGKVEKVKDNGFFVQVSRRLSLGDSIRTQPPSGEAGPSLEITMLSNAKGKKVYALGKSQTGFIHCDKDVVVGSSVYLVGRKSDPAFNGMSQLEEVTKTIALRVRVDAGGLSVESMNLPVPLAWRREEEIPAARNVSLTTDKVAAEFSLVRQDTWRAAAIEVTVEPGLFLQDKRLRQLRQEFTAWLKAQNAFAQENANSPGAHQFLKSLDDREDVHASEQVCDYTLRCQAGECSRPKEAIKTVGIFEDTSDADEVILPFFCPEEDLNALGQRLSAVLQSGMTRIRVTSLYQFSLLASLAHDRKFHIASSFPIPVCNRFTFRELWACGVRKMMLWPEMEQTPMDAMVKRFGGAVEVFREGRLPVLVTRARVPVSGRITGGHGQVFFVEEMGGLTAVYPEVGISIPAIAGASEFHDVSHAKAGEVSDFNYRREWL